MGHIRLGRLPKTARWRRVVELLESDPAGAAEIAARTLDASENYLRELADDPAVVQTYLALVRLMSAARGGRFEGELQRLGIPIDGSQPTFAFIGNLTSWLRDELATAGASPIATERVTTAMSRALMDTVGTQSVSLFGSSVEDIQEGFRQHSTEGQFGELSQRFFGDIVAGVLTSSIDRALPNTVESVDESLAVRDSIDLHARETAAIVRDFAGQWLSKRDWETSHDISESDATAFVAVALRKIRSELKREATR
jgi:hypothetical protein